MVFRAHRYVTTEVFYGTIFNVKKTTTAAYDLIL